MEGTIMQKKRIASMTAAAVMALSSAAAVIPASADTTVAAASAFETIEASTATIKFNANGGTIVGAKKKTYKKGKTLGVLPNAKKANVTFDGWYTKKTGGKRVTYKTKLAKCTNKTFYAHYKVIDQPHLKWKWENSFEGFQYPSNYITPYARYRYVFDKNYADWLWETNGFKYMPWGGNCFGMSSTASFNALCLNNLKTFNKKATYTKDIGLKNKSTKLKLTAGEFCEAAQQIQYNWGIQKMYNAHENKYQAIANAAKRVQKKKAKPVVIGVLDRVYGGGHALLPYKFVKGSKSDKVYVYDCNYPNDKNHYVELYKNASGAYYDFRYADFHDSYTDITYFPTATIWKVWQNRGKKSASGMTDEERQYYGVDSKTNATIYDANGNVYATIANGNVEGGDAVQMNVLADKWIGKKMPNIVFSLPAGEYTIKSNDGSVLSASVFYNGKSVEAEGSVLSAVKGTLAAAE